MAVNQPDQGTQSPQRNTPTPFKPMPPSLPARKVGPVDVTGKMPDDFHVDPDITEGHPGYEESGDSELNLPPDLTGGSDTEAEQPTGNAPAVPSPDATKKAAD
jgi:hypothetical protein